MLRPISMGEGCSEKVGLLQYRERWRDEFTATGVDPNLPEFSGRRFLSGWELTCTIAAGKDKWLHSLHCHRVIVLLFFCFRYVSPFSSLCFLAAIQGNERHYFVLLPSLVWHAPPGHCGLPVTVTSFPISAGRKCLWEVFLGASPVTIFTFRWNSS